MGVRLVLRLVSRLVTRFTPLGLGMAALGSASVASFYSPPSFASIWDLLTNKRGVSQASVPKDSPRIELVGTLPADTELELIGFYYSSICTEKEMYFPSGDIANPQWRTKGTTSQLRQVVTSLHNASHFTQSVALQGGGSCEWQLTNIQLNMSLLPSHRLWQEAQSLKKQYLAELPVAKVKDEALEKDAFKQSFDLIPTAKEADAASVDSNDATLSFSPIYYPIYSYAPEDKQPFDVGLKSSLQREVSDRWSLQYSRRIRLTDERVTRVSFTPQIAEDYAVNIHILDKKSKVSYPDGTEFTYIKVGLQLYPYGSAESRFNSLQRSAHLEDKRQLAKIYDSGIEHVFEGDKAKAEVLYRELGEAGDMESINWLRERARWGYIKDGQYWLEHAAKLGDIQAQLELINQPLSVIPLGKVNTGQAKIRERQAWQTLTELTKRGIPQAVSTMAYYQVFSCSPYFDTTAALDNYRKSVKAQPDLARDAAETYYYFKEDLAQAREFFEIAAEREIDVAAEYAGILLAAEQRDPKRARYWLEKVVTAGDKQYIQRDVLGYAYFRLASLLDAGEEGDADPKRAITLYQQSIELGEGFSNDYQAKAKERLQSLQERHL